MGVVVAVGKESLGVEGSRVGKTFRLLDFPPSKPPPSSRLAVGRGREGGGVVGCVVGGPYLSCVLLQYKTGIPPYTLPLQLSGSVALKQGSIYYCPATSRRFLLHLATYKCKQRRALSEEATEHCQ